MSSYSNLEGVINKIQAQQKGNEDKPAFMVGLQLIDIAKAEPASAEILDNDLNLKEMSIVEAAKELQKYADKNKGGQKCFCITPIVAEGILRDFYKLPKAEEAAQSTEKSDRLDLSSFL